MQSFELSNVEVRHINQHDACPHCEAHFFPEAKDIAGFIGAFQATLLSQCPGNKTYRWCRRCEMLYVFDGVKRPRIKIHAPGVKDLPGILVSGKTIDIETSAWSSFKQNVLKCDNCYDRVAEYERFSFSHGNLFCNDCSYPEKGTCVYANKYSRGNLGGAVYIGQNNHWSDLSKTVLGAAIGALGITLPEKVVNRHTSGERLGNSKDIANETGKANVGFPEIHSSHFEGKPQMAKKLVITGCVLIALAIGWFSFSDPAKVNLTRTLDNAFTWTAENIHEDPEGYAIYAKGEFEDAIARLQQADIEAQLSQNKIRQTLKQQQNKYDRAEAHLLVLVHQQANETQFVSNLEKAEVVNKEAEMNAVAKVIAETKTALAAVEAQRKSIGIRISECQQQVASIEANRENLRVRGIVNGLQDEIAKVEQLVVSITMPEGDASEVNSLSSVDTAQVSAKYDEILGRYGDSATAEAGN